MFGRDDNEGSDWSEAILTSLEELAPQDDRLGVSDPILTSLEELAPQDDNRGGEAVSDLIINRRNILLFSVVQFLMILWAPNPVFFLPV